MPGFFTPRIPPAPLWPQGSPQALSYYDTAPLKKTLERLVDFDRINDLKCRLSVGAVGITSGNFRYFDNVEFKREGKRIGPEHIMASGALPPGFPAVLIDGEYYWDGGIASNTPLDYVLDAETDRDLLIFQVDLFSARGLLPETLLEASRARKGHPLFQPHAHEHRQEPAAPQRPQGGAGPDRQVAGPSEGRSVGAVLREAPRKIPSPWCT